jgi:hypothetical protein
MELAGSQIAPEAFRIRASGFIKRPVRFHALNVGVTNEVRGWCVSRG